MTNRCVYNINPNLAVGSGCGGVRRKVLADFFPASTLAFVNSEDERSLYDAIEKKLREGKVKNRVLVETLVNCKSPIL